MVIGMEHITLIKNLFQARKERGRAPLPIRPRERRRCRVGLKGFHNPPYSRMLPLGNCAAREPGRRASPGAICAR